MLVSNGNSYCFRQVRPLKQTPSYLCVLPLLHIDNSTFWKSFLLPAFSLLPALKKTSVSRIIKRNFLIIRENISRLSMAFAIFFLFINPFGFLFPSRRHKTRRASVCDLHEIKTVIHVALCYQRRRKIWERLSLLFCWFSRWHGVKMELVAFSS